MHSRSHRRNQRIVVPGAILIVAILACSAPGQVPGVVDDIRREATRANLHPAGRPLPLAAHWQRGDYEDTYSPDRQRQLIEQGAYLLPNIPMPKPNQNKGDRWKDLLETYSAWNIPIAVRGDNWDLYAFNNSTWKNKPAAENPFRLNGDGTLTTTRLDSLGPGDAFFQGGQEIIGKNQSEYTSFQQWYPNPPKVVWISNNEGFKWSTDQRYVEVYGDPNDHSLDFNNHVRGGGKALRFGEMFDGMNDALDNQAWKDNSIYIGYKNFGLSWYCRVRAWQRNCNAGGAVTENDIHGNPVSFDAQIDHSWMGWDGGSPSYYTHDWSGINDYKVWSVQVESMNWVFMQKHTETQNPDFWFEMSIWDGGWNKRDRYADLGQTYTPERYGGMAKFGLWLNRPRVMREFRSHTDTHAANHPEYFEQILTAVADVHENPVLRRFWRDSELVPNHTQEHPYGREGSYHGDTELPDFADEDRWFMLDASTNVPTVWWHPNSDLWLPVHSFARVRGEAGNREWLVYAHAPLGSTDENNPGEGIEDVVLTIPDYGDITVDVSVGGDFFWLRETDGSIANPLDFPMVLGDLNADHHFTVDDLQPMLLALADSQSFEMQYIGVDWYSAGDFNNDGKLTVDDLQPFLVALAQGAAIPEPGTLALLGGGAALLLRRRRIAG